MGSANRVKLGLAGVACAVGLVVSVVPNAAHALSCAGNVPYAPWPDQADVPTDARLWGYPAENTRLLGPSGEVVPMDALAFRYAELSSARALASILVPRDSLEPNARYTVDVDYGGGNEPWRVSFVTGAGPAGLAPVPPTLLSSEQGMGSFFDSSRASRWLTLQFEGVRERGLILIGDTADRDRGGLPELPSIDQFLVDDTTLPLETLLEGPRLEWASTNESLSLGRSDCLIWPDGAGDALDARFGLFDLAGNFSGWVDVLLELPSAAEAQAVADAQRGTAADSNVLQGRPSACSMTSTPAGGAGSLGALTLSLGLVALELRRLRRRSRVMAPAI